MEGHFTLSVTPPGPLGAREQIHMHSTHSTHQPRANRPNKQQAVVLGIEENKHLKSQCKYKNKEKSLLDTDWSGEKELKEQRRT